MITLRDLKIIVCGRMNVIPVRLHCSVSKDRRETKARAIFGWLAMELLGKRGADIANEANIDVTLIRRGAKRVQSQSRTNGELWRIAQELKSKIEILMGERHG